MVKENAGTGGSFPCPCCRRSRKNAKVTTMLGERQIKAGSHSLACWMLSGGSSTRTMLHLLLASGFLTGALLWAAPRETDLDQDPRMGSTVLALNGSCREQVLQRIGQSLLRLLHLDRAPRFPAETTVQLRQTWAKEVAEAPALSAEGQTLNISPNETLLIQRGGCAQISHHITLTDLGWQSWVLHPPAFLFAECLGCPCRRKENGPDLERWVRECTPEPPNLATDRGLTQRGCCRPRGTTAIAFAFVAEDGSVTVRPLRLARDCLCRP
ncbi:uncharacterized protein LOC134294378 isoform X2 [Anolis carolinensis]|uniref:uncharacterized protein LOC134294378 isoform X2 n=1 Tax=Anolis carolinensis TaxID=28377 RepID=UPI002F2B7A41